ncbi:hypothetical protein HYU11_05905 [Candidatus Woesearchaeota archaeon]|nr:hypothetical protein [Candidatus Woesearchaeota archaeon]
MLIYAGNNENLKRIIGPSEARLTKAAGELFGRQFSRLEEMSNKLIVPTAFIEPDEFRHSATDILDNIMAADPDLPEFRKEFFYGAIFGLLHLNEGFADEIAIRLAKAAGLDYSEWEGFKQKLESEDNEKLGTYLRQLKKADLTEDIIGWQEIISGWRTQTKNIDAALTSLAKLNYAKRPHTFIPKMGNTLSRENDFCFATSVEMGKLKFDPASSTFRLMDAVRVETSPVFLLPRTYSPAEILGFEPKYPEAFTLLTYLHEYAHFAQYALQPFPLQAAITILLKTE